MHFEFDVFYRDDAMYEAVVTRHGKAPGDIAHIVFFTARFETCTAAAAAAQSWMAQHRKVTCLSAG